MFDTAVAKSSSTKSLDEAALKDGFLSKAKSQDNVLDTALVTDDEFTFTTEIAERVASNGDIKALTNDVLKVLDKAKTGDIVGAMKLASKLDDPLLTLYPLLDRFKLAKGVLTAEQLQARFDEFTRVINIIQFLQESDQLEKMRTQWIQNGKTPSLKEIGTFLVEMAQAQ